MTWSHSQSLNLGRNHLMSSKTVARTSGRWIVPSVALVKDWEAAVTLLPQWSIIQRGRMVNYAKAKLRSRDGSRLMIRWKIAAPPRSDTLTKHATNLMEWMGAFERSRGTYYFTMILCFEEREEGEGSEGAVVASRHDKGTRILIATSIWKTKEEEKKNILGKVILTIKY